MTKPDLGELASTLKMVIISQSQEEVVERIPVAGNTQPFGLLHGGANAFLVEDAGSRLAMLNAPSGTHAVGVDLSVTHIAPATSGSVTAYAKVLKRGSRIIVCEVSIFDDANRLTAIGRITCLLR